MVNQSLVIALCNKTKANGSNITDLLDETYDMDLKSLNCSGDLQDVPQGQYNTVYCEPIHSTPLALVSGLIATAIITGNMLVILAILKGSSRFHRPIYWLIIHLSFADMLVGFMLLWNYCLASLLNIHNTLTSLMIIFSLWISSVSISTFGFVLLAVDRYVQIFYKSLHRTYATRMTVGLAIFCAWFIPVFGYCILPLAFDWSCKDSCECIAEDYMQCFPISDCSQVLPPFKKVYALGVAVVLFVLLPFPIGIYTMIFIKVRRKTHAIKHSHKRQDMRLIKTLVVILTLFIITLSPTAIILVFDYASANRDNRIIDIALYLYVLAFLNSLANPLLYMWRMAAIRRSIRQRLLFCCFWKKTNGQPGRRDITSYQSERSPTILRHNNNMEDEQFIGQNNNIPLAVLCLRQMKRGRYTNSRTSTPLSERSHNNVPNHEEMMEFTKNVVEENSPIISDKSSCSQNCTDIDVTEL